MEYVINVKNINPVAAKGHTKTNNRIILKEGSWGGNFTVVMGEVTSSGKALPHFHSYEQVCYVIDGKMKLTIGGKNYELHRDMVYFAPPRVEHQVEVIGEKPLKVLIIYGSGRTENE